MKLKVSTSGIVQPYEQEISSASLGNNVIQINEVIKSAFNNSPPGTIFNPSISVTYNDPAFPSVTQVVTPAVIPNYVPRIPVPPTWVQRGADIDGEAASDFSGHSVSLSADGSRVAIGAWGNDASGNLLSNAGHVRVYQYDATKTTAVTNQAASNFGPIGWNRLGGDIDGEAASDFSGISLSLSADGSRVAIGAYLNDASGNLLSVAGHVRIYEYKSLGNNWIQLGADIDGEAANDFSGRSVSLSADGSRVAIGADSNDASGNLLSDAGHVRVYQYDSSGNNWVQLGADIDGEAANDYSGWSVSLSADGSIVAIGAGSNDATGSNAGHVRVYEYNSSENNWIQLGADIDGEVAFDNSGTSVSLSADGSRVAIGAETNDGKDSNAGHVRVYQYDATKTSAQMDQTLPNFGPIGWNRLGADIDGESANDFSGYSVSLSADGSIVAIGAYGNDASGNLLSVAGHVRVYEYNSSGNNWIQLGADIDGEAAFDYSGGSVSLSADGSIVAIGAPSNAGGHVRVYKYS
jgi:hypothetical protein